MTGESDVRSPLVLKLPKAAWLRATCKPAGDELGEYLRMSDAAGLTAQMRPAPCTDGLSASNCLEKYRRRTCRRLGNTEQTIEYLRSLLKPLSEGQKQSFVPVDESEILTNAIGSMTYQEVASHIASLRLEFVQRLMRPLLQRLMQHPRNNNVFNIPVDPVALNLPDYCARVPHPMDLGTVKVKLQLGQYSSLQQCAADIALVFSNAMSYNPAGNAIHMAASCLAEEFEVEMIAINEKYAREVSSLSDSLSRRITFNRPKGVRLTVAACALARAAFSAETSACASRHRCWCATAPAVSVSNETASSSPRRTLATCTASGATATSRPSSTSPQIGSF